MSLYRYGLQGGLHALCLFCLVIQMECVCRQPVVQQLQRNFELRNGANFNPDFLLYPHKPTSNTTAMF